VSAAELGGQAAAGLARALGHDHHKALEVRQAVTFELWLADVDRFTHDGGVQQRLLSLSSE
jgi:hypothetical protein